MYIHEKQQHLDNFIKKPPMLLNLKAVLLSSSKIPGKRHFEVKTDSGGTFSDQRVLSLANGCFHKLAFLKMYKDFHDLKAPITVAKKPCIHDDSLQRER